MPTNYKINGADTEDIFESFTLAEQSEGGVTDSKFSDGSGRFKQNGADLKTALGKTFPTSAGSYLGGANSTTYYTAEVGLLLSPMVVSEDETMLVLELWVLVAVAEGTA